MYGIFGSFPLFMYTRTKAGNSFYSSTRLCSSGRSKLNLFSDVHRHILRSAQVYCGCLLLSPSLRKQLQTQSDCVNLEETAFVLGLLWFRTKTGIKTEKLRPSYADKI